MATVNKDFRIKAGLVVEGANATVDGEDIITTGSTTDSLPEGTTNVYYTEGRAKTDAAELLTGASLTNITITGDGNGLTITAENGGITDLTGFDTDDLTEGVTNLYFTDSRAVTAVETAATSENTADKIVQRDGNGAFSAGTVTATQVTVQNAGQIFEDSSLVIESNSGYPILIQGNQNVEISSQNGDIVLNADGDTYLGSVASGNDVATTGYVDGLASNYDAAGAAATAEGAANEYTDTALESYTPTSSLDTTVGGYGYIKSADLSGLATETYVNSQGFITNSALDGYATETYVGTAIDNLVDGAPGLLDTLNEIAAAIADDENYATTMTTALAGKQDELTAGNGIDITGDTISVAFDAGNGLAINGTNLTIDSAVIATKSYVDGLASNYESSGSIATAIDALDTDNIEEGSTNLYFTDERAIDAVSAADIYPNAVIVNNVSKTVANAQTVSTASTVSGLAWAKADYRSAKLVVKAETATHSQVSEIMVTLDASDNVAITEFGVVYTDAELATVTADVSGTDVRIRVTTLNASTNVMVVGTLLI